TTVSTGNTISNCGDLTWDCSGSGGSGQSCSNFTVDALSPSASVSKTAQSTPLTVAGIQRYSFALTNTGNVALSNFRLTDAIPLNINLTKIETGVYSGTSSPIIVKYTTNASGGTYLTWPYGPYTSSTNSTLNISDIGLTAGQYVTNVRIEYGTVPVGWSATTTPKVWGTVINPGNTGVSISAGATIANTAAVDYDYLGTPATVNTSANFIFNVPPLPNSNEMIVAKTISGTAQSTYATGDSIQFKIEIEAKSSSFVNPVLTDLLPIGIDYKAGSWGYDNSSGGYTNPSVMPNFQALTNYNGTGRTLLRWSWTDMTASGGTNAAFTFSNGQKFAIKYKTTVTAAALAGTNTNPAQIQSDFMNIPSGGCKSPAVRTADTQDLDGDGNTTEFTCKCSCVNFTVASTTSLESIKWDQGELDVTWLKYPDVATTVPGGTVDYQLRVKNKGNISMKDILFVDILPHIGDKGVVVAAANRLSAWQPVLIAPINAPAGVKVYYSTEQNPCRNELAGINPTPFPTGCVDNSWSLFPPSNITDVQAVKFDFGTFIMNPADEIVLDWKMIAPPNAPQNNEVAWNSFGYIATRTDDNTVLLPAEPVKVGIKIQAQQPGIIGDKVWLDSNQNGIQDIGEAGVDGVTVDLYQDNGDGVADVQNDLLLSSKLTFDGGLYVFTDLAAGGYFTVFHIPATYGISPKDATTLDDQDSDGTSSFINNEELAITQVVQIAANDINKTLDQGIFPQPVGALGGYVWADINANGTQDESTIDGLNGITVSIYQNTSGTANPATDLLIATQSTQADNAGRPGYYLFNDLTPANYYVVFTLSNGATFTTRGIIGTSDIGDSDPNTTTGITEITSILASEVDKTWDAGLIVPTGTLSIGDIVWIETDNDGLYELGSGETGVNGVLVNLYKDTNGDGSFTPTVDALFKTTTTFTKSGELGYYIFNNLPAGNYIVQIDNSNFNTGDVLDNYGSSTGNGIAPDPDNNQNNDDNGEHLPNYGVVSQAITLSTGGEPTNDGDSDNNTNRSLDFGFYLSPCPTILALSANDAQVCSSSPNTNLSVQTNNTETAGITFLYYTNATTNPYDGNQAGILGTATGNGTTASLTGIILPNTVATYYVYAILPNLPSSPACRPSAATTIQVIDCSCQINTANLDVFCHDNGTPLTSADDYMQIYLRPTGQFLGFNGYNYTGAFTGTANYGVTTYLQSAAGTAGAGNLTLTITDIDNSTCSLNAVIIDPGVCSCDIIAAIAKSNDLSCPTPTATLTASPASGVSYLWDDGSTNSTRVVSAAGTYSVMVTDAASNLCSASANVTVNSTISVPPCVPITIQKTK
ncbi:MAG: SdrD B-like domain-containing protein, partial [Bacteroidia bacterium]